MKLKIVHGIWQSEGHSDSQNTFKSIYGEEIGWNTDQRDCTVNLSPGLFLELKHLPELPNYLLGISPLGCFLGISEIGPKLTS